jgi:Glycosyl transferase family 2
MSRQGIRDRNRKYITAGHFQLIYVLALVTSLSFNFQYFFLSPKKNAVKNHHRIPSPASLVRQRSSPNQEDEAFSACMLIMDDNHRLTEWMAYHYHVLPLRYLVVAIDPNSETSPSLILDQWRKQGMTIIEWNNTQIYGGKLKHYERLIYSKEQKPQHHRQRQNMFVRNCLCHMKKNKRTWVLLIDSDEYLLFNGKVGTKDNYAKIPYPSLQEEGAILKFLKTYRNDPQAKMNKPCISIPRMLFGAVGSSDKEIQRMVPPGFDPHKFDTLQYRKHIRRPVTYHHPLNGWGKSIIDVSRVPWSDFPSLIEAFQTVPFLVNIHEPMPKVCPRPFIPDNQTLFRINHYVGSWEAFSYRQDARQSEGRNISKWKLKADRDEQTDDNIRPWFVGFVDKYGPKKASNMLQYAGVLTPKYE